VHKNGNKSAVAEWSWKSGIACVSMFGFPEKMGKQAPEARERIERELLGE